MEQTISYTNSLLSGEMPKSTLAEANKKKDWRTHQDFPQVLIQQAKEACADRTKNNLLISVYFI